MSTGDLFDASKNKKTDRSMADIIDEETRAESVRIIADRFNGEVDYAEHMAYSVEHIAMSGEYSAEETLGVINTALTAFVKQFDLNHTVDSARKTIDTLGQYRNYQDELHRISQDKHSPTLNALTLLNRFFGSGQANPEDCKRLEQIEDRLDQIRGLADATSQSIGFFGRAQTVQDAIRSTRRYEALQAARNL